MMAIPIIHVGCGAFSLQRLQVLIDGGQFSPVACVDLDLDKSREKVSALRGADGLADRVYTTISEAKEQHGGEVCFIYAASRSHSRLIVESLERGMHTFCVKTIARSQGEFRAIIRAHKLNTELMLVQGLNNQWNEAASKMREWLRSESGIGKMLGGQCTCWGRQSVRSQLDLEEISTEGMFFYALGVHQLCQLVAAKGLPDYVTAYVHQQTEPVLEAPGAWGTLGGQCLFEYPDGVPFSYTGTRAAHANPFGFASRWSGQWMIHGERGDIRREGGRLTLYRDGGPKEDYYLKDLDSGLIEDDRIQFNAFYEALTIGREREWLQNSSLDTWILMEACNESARRNEKISVKDFRTSLEGE